MLYVLSRSVGQSRSAGFASALGLGLGGIMLAVATAFGLATVFNTFDWMVTVLRFVGSVYLVWLGVGMILDARASSTVRLQALSVAHKSFSKIVWQGILVELMNPKTALFFALFLPPFVDAHAGQGMQGGVQLQLLVLGILVPMTAIPSDLMVAWMGGTMSQFMNRQRVFREGLAWVGGLTLIFIAMNLHFKIV